MVPAFSSFLAVLCAVRLAAATFNLNTGGPSWDYTASDLANTTSQACKDAYSADIDCDNTLLEIVASLDPNFNPQASDLQSMCTTTCNNSLTQYIQNVNAACNQPGDLANVCDGNLGLPQAPVAAVGEVFLYKYGEACAMNGSNYCYLTFPGSQDWGETKFPCTDTCAIQFYQNAHNQPGSGYFFSYEYLCNQTSWWETTFAGGWQTVVQCGDGEDDVSSATASATASVVSSATADSTRISTATPSTTGTDSATSTVGSTTGSSAATATTSRATSGAVRVRSPFVRFF